MDKIIIFGAGNEGKKFKQMLMGKCKGVPELKVEYFCDNHIVAGRYVDGVKVISAYQLNKVEKLDIYICSVRYVDEIIRQLHELNVQNSVYYVPDYTYKFLYNDKDMPFAIKIDINKPRMPYLECKIVDFCNLNCSGCSACANIADKKMLNLEKFEQDCEQLKRKFSGIKILKLFGGEPLLHPDIDKFVLVARKCFPDSQLLIHSNGLLISKCSNELLDLVSIKNAKFVFTLYPETGKVQRGIEQKLSMHNIEYEFTPPVYEFRKAINSKGDWDPKEVYANCCKCINLVDGTLSCGFPFLVEMLQNKYKVKICDNRTDHVINIYTTDMDGWQINKLLDSPYHLCAYCAFMRFNVLEDNYYFTWKREKPQIEDWIL